MSLSSDLPNTSVSFTDYLLLSHLRILNGTLVLSGGQRFAEGNCGYIHGMCICRGLYVL